MVIIDGEPAGAAHAEHLSRGARARRRAAPREGGLSAARRARAAWPRASRARGRSDAGADAAAGGQARAAHQREEGHLQARRRARWATARRRSSSTTIAPGKHSVRVEARGFAAARGDDRRSSRAGAAARAGRCSRRRPRDHHELEVPRCPTRRTTDFRRRDDEGPLCCLLLLAFLIRAWWRRGTRRSWSREAERRFQRANSSTTRAATPTRCTCIRRRTIWCRRRTSSSTSGSPRRRCSTTRAARSPSASTCGIEGRARAAPSRPRSASSIAARAR